ncbi:hypothetical protein GQ457_05G018750 [Hibiscus cannabinus]
MKRYEETIEDVCVIEKTLRSLTPNFDYVVCVIESNDLDLKSMEQVIGQLQAQEDRFNRRQDETIEQALKANKFGHFSWDCQNEGRNEEMVNLIKDQQDVEEPTLLLALKNEENNDACIWYLDNGASNHMCGDKEAFVELDEKVKGNVSFGDSSKVQIQGKETILISLKDDSHSLITDVYYVPKLSLKRVMKFT